MQIEISDKSYHRLNRAKNVAFHMHLHTITHGLDRFSMLWIGDIFSYVSDDISEVLEEIEDFKC